MQSRNCLVGITKTMEGVILVGLNRPVLPYLSTEDLDKILGKLKVYESYIQEQLNKNSVPSGDTQ